MNMSELKYWVALSTVPTLGAARFRRMESYFDNLEQAWQASASQLQEAGLDSRSAREIVAARQRVNPDDGMASLSRSGVKATCWIYDDYPPRLKEIPDPPPVLYYVGTLLPEDECAVAIVGTRNPTSYGREVASVISRDLATAGMTVVSGLALGIDGMAHRAALESGGRTIAVVAGGLDSVYPREHTGLFRQIQESGAVVSEHPLGVRPDSRNFPRRNRLISGMTLGTLVVEAGEGSGTRWTVQQALEQNREVFCVPGNIFSPASRYTNRMIKEGAKLVADYTDVLEELNLPDVSRYAEDSTARQNPSDPASDPAGVALTETIKSAEEEYPEDMDNDMDKEEASLFSLLSGEPVHVDDLCRQTGIPIATLSSMLTLLELKGRIVQVGSMHYVRAVRASAVEVTHGG